MDVPFLDDADFNTYISLVLFFSRNNLAVNVVIFVPLPPFPALGIFVEL